MRRDDFAKQNRGSLYKLSPFSLLLSPNFQLFFTVRAQNTTVRVQNDRCNKNESMFADEI